MKKAKYGALFPKKSRHMFQCVFCKTDFLTKSAMVYHQKSAKYCLSKQGLPLPQTTVKCEFCSKTYSTIYTLADHQKACSVKQELATKAMDHVRMQEVERTYEKKLTDTARHYENMLAEAQHQIRLLEQEMNYQQKHYETILREKELHYEALLIAKDNHYHRTEKTLEKSMNDIAEIAKQANANANIDDAKNEVIPVSNRMQNIMDHHSLNAIYLSSLTLNNVNVTARSPDHYVSATELCQAGEKQFSAWYRLDSTKEVLSQLSSDTGIPVSLLVETKREHTSEFEQGTWIHPDLAIQLAQWVSPAFALQVSRWVRSLFDARSVQLDLKLLKLSQQRVIQLEDVCLSKKRRIEYKERNVVYMITTDDHKKRRTYIIGKAKDLTARLATYNKTCDHKVIHYRECLSEQHMSTAEVLILSKMNDYREQSNRDRFILPMSEEETFFTSIIDKCVDFVSDQTK